MTPADIVISRFEGARALARLLGRDPSSVHRWRMPASKGGLDGRVPSALQLPLLELAQQRGIALTAEELISGKPVVNVSPVGVEAPAVDNPA